MYKVIYVCSDLKYLKVFSWKLINYEILKFLIVIYVEYDVFK